MQFFFLVLVNIFIGAVLYLVISLKLERSAQEFRSQRLRKEMDEIIKEFNSTAERNITLLENKITVLQRLLERTGSFKSLDISIGDETEPAAAVSRRNEPATVPAVPEADPSPALSSNRAGISAFSRKITRRMRDGMNSLFDALEKHAPPPDQKIKVRTDDGPAVSAENRSDHGGTAETVETVYLDETEIREIILSAENRAEAISRLHGQGYSLDQISKCSGIPAGEITLVLNLQNTRTS